MMSKLFQKQECIPVGCVPSASVAICGEGMCLPRGVCVCPGVSSRGVVCLVGVCQGGCLPGGCLPGGCLPRGCVSQHALGQTPPPLVDRMTDRRKNITFPQLRLWTVNMLNSKFKLNKTFLNEYAMIYSCITKTNLTFSISQNQL